MTRLSADDFDMITGHSDFTIVVFGKSLCRECEILVDRLHSATQHVNVGLNGVYRHHVDHGGSKDLMKLHRIGLLPRTLVFKDGVEVGRFLFVPSVDQLIDIMNELKESGRYLADPSDPEEVSRFYGVVINAMDINWKSMNDEERQKKGDEVINTSHDIIGLYDDWSVLGVDAVRKVLRGVNECDKQSDQCT